jgi:hypothetical protein
MEITYETIIKFMKGYFETYDKYGQDPKTIHRLDEYYAKNFGGRENGREEIYKNWLNHPNLHDQLIPMHLIVDERKCEVCVICKAIQTNPHTGEILLTAVFSPCYNVILDKNNRPKLAGIGLVSLNLHPGLNADQIAILDWLFNIPPGE